MPHFLLFEEFVQTVWSIVCRLLTLFSHCCRHQRSQHTALIRLNLVASLRVIRIYSLTLSLSLVQTCVWRSLVPYYLRSSLCHFLIQLAERASSNCSTRIKMKGRIEELLGHYFPMVIILHHLGRLLPLDQHSLQLRSSLPRLHCCLQPLHAVSMNFLSLKHG